MNNDLRPKPQHAGVRPANHRAKEHGAATDPESVRAFFDCAHARQSRQSDKVKLKVPR